MNLVTRDPRGKDPAPAFEDSIRAHIPKLLRTAVLLAGEEHGGHDLLQDALEQTLRVHDRRPIEFPAAYVRTVMIRLLHRRRHQRRMHLVRLEGHDQGGADDMGRADERQVLLGALAALPPKRRSAVVLRHWEGYSESETARLLGCTVGTVKSQTHRALEALRISCGPSFPNRGDTPARKASSRPTATTPRFPSTTVPDLLGGTP